MNMQPKDFDPPRRPITGEELRRLREEAGFRSQTEAIRAFGKGTQQGLSNIESGKTAATSDLARDLHRFYVDTIASVEKVEARIDKARLRKKAPQFSLKDIPRLNGESALCTVKHDMEANMYEITFYDLCHCKIVKRMTRDRLVEWIQECQTRRHDATRRDSNALWITCCCIKNCCLWRSNNLCHHAPACEPNASPHCPGLASEAQASVSKA